MGIAAACWVLCARHWLAACSACGSSAGRLPPIRAEDGRPATNGVLATASICGGAGGCSSIVARADQRSAVCPARSTVVNGSAVSFLPPMAALYSERCPVARSEKIGGGSAALAGRAACWPTFSLLR
eukprot:5298345-Prymnesium_polylepis.1